MYEDFNVNILEVTPLSITSLLLLNLFRSFNLINLSCKLTRVTAFSSTCLDNMFCEFEVKNKLVLCDLSPGHCGFIAENRMQAIYYWSLQ